MPLPSDLVFVFFKHTKSSGRLEWDTARRDIGNRICFCLCSIDSPIAFRFWRHCGDQEQFGEKLQKLSHNDCSTAWRQNASGPSGHWVILGNDFCVIGHCLCRCFHCRHRHHACLPLQAGLGEIALPQFGLRDIVYQRHCPSPKQLGRLRS